MRYLVTSILLMCALMLFASVDKKLSEKEKAIKEYRQYFSSHPYRISKLKTDVSLDVCWKLLQADGKFSDLLEVQNKIEKNKTYLEDVRDLQDEISEMNGSAHYRLWAMAEAYRENLNPESLKDPKIQKLINGFINYGELELKRANVSAGRFHTSCFGIPISVTNTYFIFFELMEKVETGVEKNPLAIKFNKVLKDVGMQAWTQPYRNDETDKNVVQVERFRKHVWWVGGNGMTYRPVQLAAFMMGSVEMVDVLAEVSKRALSNVSQHTYDDAFWTEGFTADGAGWGHGMQCLIWGYPINGTNSALTTLSMLKGSPWAQKIGEKNIEALFNFFRGSSWYYYKGYELPCLSRHSMEYVGEPQIIKTQQLVSTLRNDLSSSLSKAYLAEADLYLENAENNLITMKGQPDGYYTGTRWFFNNDNLVKKTPNYQAYISMASIRCDGIEIADWNGDGYNFFTCDGLTFYQKYGYEYERAKGAWNMTAIPGVTNRQGEDKLIPITNWRGYCSKYNFAAAATSGGQNAASGFVFEKLNGSAKKKVNDRQGLNDPNTIIYGVKAHKAWFMLGDYTVALGAGITNKKANNEGDVWTTIDQTLWQGDVKWKSSDSNGDIAFGKDTKSVKLMNEGEDVKQLVWAQQGKGFSYAVIPEQTTGSVYLTVENRATKWNKIHAKNKAKENLPKDVNIFQLWINHGQKVKDGKYGYITYMGEDKTAANFEKNPIKVLQNDTLIQAASTLNEQIIGAAIYDTSSILKTSEWEMMASEQCAVLFEIGGKNCKLSVTDARMDKNLKFIKISTTLPLTGNSVQKDGKWNIVSVPMPQGSLCGKPGTVQLSLK